MHFGLSEQQKQRRDNPIEKPTGIFIPELTQYTCDGCIYRGPHIVNYSPCRSCIGGKTLYYFKSE